MTPSPAAPALIDTDLARPADGRNRPYVPALVRVKDQLAETIDKDVAALWRLLDAASGNPLGPRGQTTAAPDDLAQQESAASADKLAHLLSDLTLRLAPEARKGLMPQLLKASALPPEAALELALDISPEGLKFCELSPVLNAAMLYHLIYEGREATQIAVARRKDLEPEHIHALINRPGFLVAYQVLKNRYLHLKPAHIEALTGLALTHTALRSPLLARPELGELDALRLSDVLGPELKSGLTRRFPNLDLAYPQAPGLSEHVKPGLDHTETPFLVNCLSRGLMTAYARGVAVRFGLDDAALLAALNGPSFVPLALTLSALGVDRAAFNGLLRKHAARMGLDPAAGHERLARSIFALSPNEAEARLRAIPIFLENLPGI